MKSHCRSTRISVCWDMGFIFATMVGFRLRAYDIYSSSRLPVVVHLLKLSPVVRAQSFFYLDNWQDEVLLNT
jgi:hypothetical protein